MRYIKQLHHFTSNSPNKVNRMPISNTQLDAIRLNSTNIPEDYITYLKVVGAGDLVPSKIKIYPTLCDFSDFGLEEIYLVDDGIMFFGDNYSGDFFGFDLSNSDDEVIEFWHDSETVHRTGKSFREFVRGYF